MKDPSVRVKYTCQITDGGHRAMFTVTAEDEGDAPITAHSPSAAWRVVLERISAVNPAFAASRKSNNVSGAFRFGLNHPVVAQLLRELPGADSQPSAAAGEMEETPSSSPAPSPVMTRKRKSTIAAQAAAPAADGSSSDESLSPESTDTYLPDEATEVAIQQRYSKSPKYERAYDVFSARDVPVVGREDMEDLENAVVKLMQLKHSGLSLVF